MKTLRTRLNGFGCFYCLLVAFWVSRAAAAPVVFSWGSNSDGQTNVPASLTNVVSLVAGANFGVALRGNGQLVAWGHNNVGQTTIPAAYTNMVAVAAGGGHGLALRTNGTVAGWGYNASGEATPPAGLSNVVAIAAFGSHSLALRVDGTVVGWGDNANGESTIPAGLNNVVQIAAGHFHSLALKADRTVVAWGRNAEGQSTVPVGLINVVGIAGGYYHSLALREDGTVVAWGRNDFGQSTVPAAATNVVRIAAGYNHSLAVRADGTEVAWGDNSFKQTQVPGPLAGAFLTSGGFYHSLALAGASAPFVRLPTLSYARYSGNSLRLLADATGSLPLSYQWELNGADILGATNATLPLTQLTGEQSGAYRVRVANSVGTATNLILNLTVTDSAPVISQLASQRIYPGAPAAFSVTVDGSAPLSYQWRFNGVDIPDATNATLIFPATQLSQFGQYQVVVSNPLGVATKYANLAVIPVVAWGRGVDGQTNVPTTLRDAVAISAGANFGFALRRDSTITGWGHNNVAQLNFPAGLSNVTAIASGGGHSLALKSDGTVVGWGYNATGEATIPPGLSGVTAIAAFGSHSLALKNDGTVVGWGANADGESTPPPGLNTVVKIAAGHYHSLALKADGTVVAWGKNTSGQATVPGGLANVVQIAGGFGHSLALKQDGTVVAWGDNTNGQRTVPGSLSGVVAISAGYDHSLAVKADGTVVAWGRNDYGQLNAFAGLSGIATVAGGQYHSLAMVKGSIPIISALPTETSVFAGNAATFKAEIHGTPPLEYQWQLNGVDIVGATNASLTVSNLVPAHAGNYSIKATNPQGVGIGSVGDITVLAVPPVITAATTNQTVYPGGSATFSVTAIGSGPLSYRWQFNEADLPGETTSTLNLGAVRPDQFGRYAIVVSNPYGTVAVTNIHLTMLPVTVWGDNSAKQRQVPVGLSDLVAISAGANFNLALRTNGTVVAWGDNSVGQTNVPVAATNVVALAAGGGHGMVLRSNGTVLAWGYNATGEAEPPVGLSNVVAIAAFGSHSLALKSDSTLVGWGANTDGESTIPAGLSNVVKIAAGHFHSLALKADSTVAAWGRNAEGQSSVPAGLTNVVGIAGGYYHSLALRADGTVVAWGKNDFGQCNVPITATEVVAVAAGYYHSLAVKADGTMLVWGYNNLGQTTVPAGLSSVVMAGGGYYHSVALAGANAPFIRTPTLARTNFLGRALTLLADAVGTFPLSYQWELNGVDILGATNATLPLTQLSSAQSGDYRLRVANSAGTANRLIVNLTVADSAPVISQPVSLRIHPGAPAAFSVTVDGSAPLSYQWRLNGVDIPDATNATLIFPATQLSQFGQYQVVVSNPLGVVSKYANLAVIPVVAWGRNADGQTNVPTTLRDAVAISAGANFGLALRRDTTVTGWGHNNVAQLNFPAGLSNVTAIASGGGHSIALKSDGTVVGWGYNATGEATVPPGLNGVTAIAAFGSHSLALKNNGTVVGWGANGDGESTPPLGLNTVVKIAAGHYHSLALKADGTVVAWGRNSSGQATVPGGLANVVQIAGGFSHSLALKQDGTVVAWGDNTHGQRTVPGSLSGVVAISAGYDHSLAVKADGTVVAWGRNDYGQLNAFAGLTGIATVAGGQYHSLAMVQGGIPIVSAVAAVTSVFSGASITFKAEIHGAPPLSYQWQRNGVDIAEATDATLTLTGLVPANSGNYSVRAANGHGVGFGSVADLTVLNAPPVIIAASTNQSTYPGGTASFMVTADGSGPLSYQWQLNETDLAGETNPTLNLGAVRLDQFGRYGVVVSNPFGTVAVTNIQLTMLPVTAWGDNSVGQLQVPAGLSNLVAISAGANFTLALRTNGAVVAWGDNNVSQINVPVTATNVVALAAGGGHGLVLRSNGTVVAWGYNTSGEANPPVGLSNVIAITAFGAHNLALKVDGTVVGWGSNGSGESTPPAGLNQVTKVAAGHFHSLALKRDRTVVAWGLNTSGQTSVPAGLTNAIGIAGGYDHSLALKSDGTVVAWGSNEFGQCTVPPSATNVVAVYGGYYHSVAMRANGTVLVWGRNNFGQRDVPAGLTNVFMASGGYFHTVAMAGRGEPFVLSPSLTRSLFAGQELSLQVTVSGAWPPAYQWLYNDGEIDAATNATYTVASALIESSGTYSVRVSNAAGSVTARVATVTVSKGSPTLTWANPGNIVFGTALGAAQLNATANTPGSFVYNPPAETLLHAGSGQTLSVTFSPTDTVNYFPATASVTINVGKANQTINFGTLSGKTYGNAPFGVNATASSELPVTFAVQSGPATLAVNTVTINGDGTVVVRATQAGNGDFNPAPPVDQSFVVSRAAPVLVMPADRAVGELMVLIVTNLATDINVSPRSLVFSLESAPTGVNLAAATGVLTWTPSEEQGPGVFPISVRVSDPLTPGLNATGTFTVTVNEVNSAPALMPIGFKLINQGNQLTVTNLALDTDLPANHLTFTLLSAPEGATIDAKGVVTWTPSPSQGSTEGVIRVKVADDGVPSLSATNLFTVFVNDANSRPELDPIIAPGSPHFTFNLIGEAGRTYVLQVSTNLTQWTYLQTITNVDGLISVTDTNALRDLQRRYYRVLRQDQVP